MAFIRTKKQNEREYYYLVENKRVKGKVRQKTIAFLGEFDSIEARAEWLEERIDRFSETVRRARKRAADELASVRPSTLEYWGGEIPKPRKWSWRGSTPRRYWGAVEWADKWEKQLNKYKDQLVKLKEYQSGEGDRTRI